MSPVERITTRVNIDPATGCWIWPGARTRGGYGTINVGGRTRLTHRVVYAAIVGPIPHGYELDHHVCRVTLCCNPDHLEAVTPSENSRRQKAERLSRTAPRTPPRICPRQHLIWDDGECRRCQELQVRRWLRSIDPSA